MSERRPATTIGELDIHISNLQSRMTEVLSAMQNTATKADIDGIKISMSSLATKAEVASDIAAIREEVQRNKPGTLMRNVAALLGMITLVGAVVALMFEGVRSYDGRPGVAAK